MLNPNPNLLVKINPDNSTHTLVLLWKFDDGGFQRAIRKEVPGPVKATQLRALTADWQQWPTMTRAEFDAFKAGMGEKLGTVEKEPE